MAKLESQEAKASSSTRSTHAIESLMAEKFAEELHQRLKPVPIVAGSGRQGLEYHKPFHPGAIRSRAAVGSHGKIEEKELAMVMLATSVLAEAIESFRKEAFLSFDPAVVALVEPIARLVGETRQQESEAAIESLVKALLPRNDPLNPVMSRIEQDNAAARVRFLETVPFLTNNDLAELAGHKAGNKSATGTRWKAAGRVFSVPQQGKELYPSFQFADGQPRPTISKVLASLPKTMSAWQIAFWFVSSNAYLDGAEPYHRLDDVGAVTAAARAETEGFTG